MYVSLNREDMFTPDSVEQLQKAGIDFQRHEEYGILPNDFAELMITSGMVLSQDTNWISFHRYVEFHFHSKRPYNQPSGSCILDHGTFSNSFSTLIHWICWRKIGFSGYDFGYFVKLLTAQSLPTSEDAFFALLKMWFPTVYDIKFLMKASKALKGGLQEVADDLGVCYPCHYQFLV